MSKRPKYHLLASIFYLFNFWYRKIERRSNLFEDIEKQFVDARPTQDLEQDFDTVLDIIVRSIQDNYGDDEYNLALDMASLLPQDDVNEFERLIKER